MLGPGIILTATPFAFGYSLFARARTSKRVLTYTAIIISALELLVILYGIISGVVSAVTA